MNLECLNDIITDNLAIYIDLTQLKSWNLNSGFTSFSLTKWVGAVSDNINLIDFGLTEFDNGRTNVMWSGITLTPSDTYFSMYRVGRNDVQNPTTGETSGITVNTIYDIYPMSATSITGGSMNYFDLSGGYLQGFFKLKDYNYELFPARYNNGITIETLLYLYPESQGIFYMMGTRAEDKYNPYFSGETITGGTITGITVTGVTTSLDNYLDAILETQKLKPGFSVVEDKMVNIFTGASQINNIKNNAIAFELTEDKRLAYKYINKDGLIITNVSSAIINKTGFTWITIAFTPDFTINDPDLLECAEQRTGKLVFYVNGRAAWIINEFPEFYFHAIENDKEKQIGVPYSISWGGGSFGLENSWHYDYQTYRMYKGQDANYVNANFFVEADPISTQCYIAPTGDTYLSGLTLGISDMTFYTIDECDPNVIHPYTVMYAAFTGSTGSTGSTFFIKYNHPVSVLSNRLYEVNAEVFNDWFFNSTAVNKVSILVYSDTVDVDIIDDVEYTSGYDVWIPIKKIFKITDNTGQQFVNIGILIESSLPLLQYNQLFIKDFVYTAADILVQDDRKNNLTIEQNFNESFIGGIQKLRIYDRGFTSQEVLHNILVEIQNNPGQNILMNKGGRIIYR